MITIEKAIDVLYLEYRKRKIPYDDELIDAHLLGIEALKRIQSKRITMSYHPDDLLPGEAK